MYADTGKVLLWVMFYLAIFVAGVTLVDWQPLLPRTRSEPIEGWVLDLRIANMERERAIHQARSRRKRPAPVLYTQDDLDEAAAVAVSDYRNEHPTFLGIK